MSCEICGRNACTRSFHSFEAQERHDAKQLMSDDIDTLREQILNLKEENRMLQIELEENNHES